MSDIDDVLDFYSKAQAEFRTKHTANGAWCENCMRAGRVEQSARLELAALREEVATARELLIDVFDLWDDDAIEHSTPDNYTRARAMFDRIRAALPPEKRAALASKEEA